MNLISNAKWNTFSQLFKILAQLINIVYISKIISPSDYGLMAIALVFTNLANLLRDLGTSASLIQTRNLNNNLINSVFWFNLILGIGLAVLLCMLSPVISFFYSEHKLIPILCLLSLTFPLSSVATAHLALLERKSMFRCISIIEIISSVISLIFAIFLACSGYGVYSLVFQAIVLNLCSSILFGFFSKWIPSPRVFIDWGEIRKIFKFSSNLAGFNLINYFSRNMDSFLIGKFMNPSILGVYSLAYRIMLFPLQSLTFVMSRSLYPILSNHQDNNSLIRFNYFKCVFYVLSISFPVMTLLSIFSSQVIITFIGSKWLMTGLILHWLAPTAIIQSFLSTTGSVFTAKGRTDILFKLGCFGAFIQVAGFLIGINFDIFIFSKIYLLTNIINFFPVTVMLLKVIDANWRDLLHKIMPITISTIAMLALYFLFISSRITEYNNIYSCIFSSIIMLLFYSLCLFITLRGFKRFKWH